MNRKKAILLISAVQAFLTAMIIVLFLTGAIKIATFVTLVIVIGLVATVSIVLAFHKLH